MGRIKKGIMAAAACVAVGAVFVGAVNVGGNQSGGAEAQAFDDRVPVAASAPSRGDIIVTGEFIGTVEPDRQVTVFPKAAGEVLNVNYEAGDVVEAGAVLCEIDSKALKASISQMQAAVASAQAKADYNLAVAQNDLDTYAFNLENGYDATLNNAEAAVKDAERRLEAAKVGLASANANWMSARTSLRNLRDYEEDVVTGGGIVGDFNYTENENQRRAAVRQYEIALENAELTVESAELALTQAKDNLRTLQVMSKEQQISAKSRVHIAELNTNLSDQYIAIQKLQDDLANYTVASPIGGVIESRSVDPYDMVSQQSPLFVVADKNAMTVTFNVSETNLAHIREGETVNIDKNGTLCTGTVTEVSSSVDARSGLFAVKAIVENPPSVLFSGSTVKVFADVQKAENDLLLPIDAIYYENGKPYVYIADNGTAKKTYVETGISDEKNIQILSGVALDDLVITTWNSNLADGSKIKLGADENDASVLEASGSGEE